MPKFFFKYLNKNSIRFMLPNIPYSWKEFLNFYKKYAESKLNPSSPDALDSIEKKQLALASGALGPVERSGV